MKLNDGELLSNFAFNVNLRPYNAVNPWAWVYFVLMIVFGSFFAVNLALAVLYVFFTGANDDEVEAGAYTRPRFSST